MLTHQRGTTLIEALIAIAIIALLVAAGLPSFAEWLQNTKIRTAAESVQNGLQIARTEAVKRNATVAFQATDLNNANWRVCLWDAAAGNCAAGVDLVSSFVSSDGASDVRIGGSRVATDPIATPLVGVEIPGRVSFTGFGRLASGGAELMRIDVTNPKLAAADQRRLVIQISAGGQIKMCDPKLKLADNPRGCA